MNDSELLVAVQEAISAVLDVDEDEVQPHTKLMGDLAAESIDLLDIASELEKALGKPVDFKELPKPASGQRSDIEISEIIIYLKGL